MIWQRIVFELAIDNGGTVTRERLTRHRFLQYIAKLSPTHIVMEACGSVHHWARHLRAKGHDVVMLPAQHVKPYRRGNKTDRADANALLQADRVVCSASNFSILSSSAQNPEDAAKTA
ncbi:MAG: IS110 family transposase [Pseudomonadota bacterium]